MVDRVKIVDGFYQLQCECVFGQLAGDADQTGCFYPALFSYNAPTSCIVRSSSDKVRALKQMTVCRTLSPVSSYHLSDDVFLEYNRTINANTYLTVGVRASFPGAGIDSMIDAKAPIWTGGFANVVVNY
nr:hypothetical protein [[Ochrobactrum] quorumnocens]